MQVLEASTALAISASICYVGSTYAASLGMPGFTIPIVTAITGACLRPATFRGRRTVTTLSEH